MIYQIDPEIFAETIQQLLNAGYETIGECDCEFAFSIASGGVPALVSTATQMGDGSWAYGRGAGPSKEYVQVPVGSESGSFEVENEEAYYENADMKGTVMFLEKENPAVKGRFLKRCVIMEVDSVG